MESIRRILTDAHLHLIRSGAVTGLRKTLHQGKIVTSYCMGSRELYDFVDNNPEVEIYPIEYVNNRKLISRHDRMVAINSALEIDLSGQICADSIGHKVYSGIGGYVDFMHGGIEREQGQDHHRAAIHESQWTQVANRKPSDKRRRGGQSAQHGPLYRYRVRIAYLHGKTIRERALALINIAHPRFRERLLAEAKSLHYVYQDQILPPIYEPLYPGQWETHQDFSAKRGSLFFRPIKPTDERALQEFFYSLPIRTFTTASFPQ